MCIPLVVETYGAWGQDAVKTFAQLASRLAIACSKPKSVIINEIEALKRSNGMDPFPQ